MSSQELASNSTGKSNNNIVLRGGTLLLTDDELFVIQTAWKAQLNHILPVFGTPDAVRVADIMHAQMDGKDVTEQKLQLLYDKIGDKSTDQANKMKTMLNKMNIVLTTDE